MSASQDGCDRVYHFTWAHARIQHEFDTTASRSVSPTGAPLASIQPGLPCVAGGIRSMAWVVASFPSRPGLGAKSEAILKAVAGKAHICRSPTPTAHNSRQKTE